MPPKSARKRQSEVNLEKAREVKRACTEREYRYRGRNREWRTKRFD